MRLRRKGACWEPHFTQVWEVAFLEDQPEGWVPFFLVGQNTPMGQIHTRSHDIRLVPGWDPVDRQVVVLGNR